MKKLEVGGLGRDDRMKRRRCRRTMGVGERG